MKQLALFVVLVFGFVNQSVTAQSGIYGIRAGLTLSDLNFNGETPDMLDTDMRNSFYIGFFADFRLSNTVAFVPELQFSPEGVKEEQLQLDFIQLPLFFKFKVHEKLRLGIGPQFAVNTNRLDEFIRDVHFSSVAGIEYKINQMFFVDFRYSKGFIDVFKSNSPNTEAINTNFQLGVGYQF